MDVYDDIDVLHFISDSQRLSFFQELTFFNAFRFPRS